VATSILSKYAGSGFIAGCDLTRSICSRVSERTSKLASPFDVLFQSSSDARLRTRNESRETRVDRIAIIHPDGMAVMPEIPRSLWTVHSFEQGQVRLAHLQAEGRAKRIQHPAPLGGRLTHRVPKRNPALWTAKGVRRNVHSHENKGHSKRKTAASRNKRPAHDPVLHFSSFDGEAPL
jgi:hypothetical protein